MNEEVKFPDNKEIDRALKEFEAKSNPEEKQQTTEVSKHDIEGVKFDTDSYKAVKFYSETTAPKMIQSVMRWSGGAIKEERHAEYVLLGFVVAMILLSIFLFSRGGPKTEPPPFTPLIEQAGSPSEILQ